MQLSNRTIIAVTCIVLSLAAFWSRHDLPVVPNAAAQSGAFVVQRANEGAETFAAQSRARIQAKLAEPIPDVSFHQMPLREVLVELKELTGISMYFDQDELGNIIDPDAPITIDVDANSMTYKTLIGEFILGPQDLVVVPRDNFLMVMSYDKSLTEYEIVVYNCRDLLVGMPAHTAAAAPSGDSAAEGAESPEGGIAALGGTGTGAMPVPETFSDIGGREQQLVEIVQMTIRTEDSPWDDGSGAFGENTGSVQAFNGLLVIRGISETHEEVQQLLRFLRESAKEKEWPADLGNWPHRKRNSPAAAPPAAGGEAQPMKGVGQGFF